MFRIEMSGTGLDMLLLVAATTADLAKEDSEGQPIVRKVEGGKREERIEQARDHSSAS